LTALADLATIYTDEFNVLYEGEVITEPEIFINQDTGLLYGGAKNYTGGN